MACFEVKKLYREYAAARFPGISYTVGDVFTNERPFDLAIASHVIEHVADPADFVSRLLDRVTFFCVVYVPFRERGPLCPRHLHRFDEARIGSMRGLIWSRVMRSAGWRPATDASVAAFVCATRAAQQQIDLDALTHRLDQEFKTFPLPLARAST